MILLRVLKQSEANTDFPFIFSLQAMKGEKGIGGTVTTGDSLSEELTEEAFSKLYFLIYYITTMAFPDPALA